MSDEELVKRLVRFEGKTCVSSDDEVLAADAIERLTRERDEARAYAVKRADEAHGIEIALHARADAAERKVEVLREALDFYANEEVYKPDWRVRADDLTFKARAALAETENGDE